MNVTGQFQGPAVLPPVKEHLVPIKYEAGRAPESEWALWKIVISGFRPKVDETCAHLRYYAA
jgi:hypothetical protein